jgi:cytochrome b pre-mRNA-processing protein 3
MKSGLFRRSPNTASIDALYGAIVAQARLPVFYRDYGVPDTVNGRLEMILIHTFLLSRRSRRGAEDLQRIGQAVFDLFCDDMDANLREMGVGDLAVPKQMRRIGEAFYGRARAYEAALDANDPASLSEALLRNVFGSELQQQNGAQRLATYIKAADVELGSLPDAQLYQGRISLPDPGMYA